MLKVSVFFRNLQPNIHIFMLTKDFITELKNNGNGDVGYLVEKQRDNKSIIFILENLGALPENFDELVRRVTENIKLVEYP